LPDRAVRFGTTLFFRYSERFRRELLGQRYAALSIWREGCAEVFGSRVEPGDLPPSAPTTMNGSSFAGRRSQSCRHLTGETIPKRPKQGGGFGAFQPPATIQFVNAQAVVHQGQPLLLSIWGAVGAKFRQLPCKLPNRLHSQCASRVRASVQGLCIYATIATFLQPRLSVICLTDSLVAWK